MNWAGFGVTFVTLLVIMDPIGAVPSSSRRVLCLLIAAIGVELVLRGVHGAFP